MNRKIALLTLALVIILLISALVVFENSIPKGEASPSPFYVGIEFGYGNASDCNALVDKVKNYTNLLVISSTNITQSEALLNATCDYAYNAGLHLIVFFPQSDTIYSNTGGGSYHPYLWGMKAKDKYGPYFLGSYIYDEPGGEVLDKAAGALNINYISNSGSGAAYPISTDYKSAANNFATNARNQMDAYLYCAKKTGTSIMTADYGLYWFDYLSGYHVVLAQIGWNNSFAQNIALVRGAATLQNKDWGIVITWKYNAPPYLDNGSEIFSQMRTAYECGAKYIVLFNYYENDQNPYGTMKDEHFLALENFWNEVVKNPNEIQGSVAAETALVLPNNYGWGMRWKEDKIWGVMEPDQNSLQIWDSLQKALANNGFHLDITYDNPTLQVTGKYQQILYWNQTK